MASTRKKRSVQALRLLGQERFSLFIRAAIPQDRQGDGPLAVKLILEELEAGSDALSLFLDGDEYGYDLTVNRTGADRFRIRFACVPGPNVGDGGEWDVLFHNDGSVRDIVPLTHWMT